MPSFAKFPSRNNTYQQIINVSPSSSLQWWGVGSSTETVGCAKCLLQCLESCAEAYSLYAHVAESKYIVSSSKQRVIGLGFGKHSWTVSGTVKMNENSAFLSQWREENEYPNILCLLAPRSAERERDTEWEWQTSRWRHPEMKKEICRPMFSGVIFSYHHTQQHMMNWLWITSKFF